MYYPATCADVTHTAGAAPQTNPALAQFLTFAYTLCFVLNMFVPGGGRGLLWGMNPGLQLRYTPTLGRS